MASPSPSDTAIYDAMYSSKDNYEWICWAHQPDIETFASFVEGSDIAGSMSAGETVKTMEMGCGIGKLTIRLLGAQRFNYQMLAVDLNDVAVTSAGKQLETSDLRAELRSAYRVAKADITKPAQLQQGINKIFKTEHADLIIAQWTLHTLKDPVSVLQGWAKLLRSGGRIIVDFAASTDVGWQRQADFLGWFEYTMPAAGRSLASIEQRNRRFFRFATKESWGKCEEVFRQIAGAAGLSVVRVKHMRDERAGMVDMSAGVARNAEKMLQSKMAKTVQPSREEVGRFEREGVVPLSYIEKVGEARMASEHGKLSSRTQVAAVAGATSVKVDHQSVMVLAELRKA